MYQEICRKLLFLLFHAVARRAGVRLGDRPNTETVSLFSVSARKGAKFVFTKMWEVLQLWFSLEQCTFLHSEGF